MNNITMGFKMYTPWLAPTIKLSKLMEHKYMLHIGFKCVRHIIERISFLQQHNCMCLQDVCRVKLLKSPWELSNRPTMCQNQVAKSARCNNNNNNHEDSEMKKNIFMFTSY